MAGDALFVSGGVTDAREGRLASSGLLAVTGPTVLDIRTGVLHGPGSTALLTGTSDTGPMTVQIGPHVAVTTRGTANGPYIGPSLEAATKVNIAAAPGSGSRIDVVYVKQQDATAGVPTPDGATAPLYGVLQGTSSTGTPLKPDLSAIVGAVELGTATVAAGATSTSGAGVTITNTARQTVARGVPIPVRNQAERDALTAGGAGYLGLTVKRLDVAYAPMESYDPASGKWQRYVLDEDSGWQDITINAGFASNGGEKPQVRRWRGLLFFQGAFANTGMTAGGNFTVGALPAGTLPALTWGVGGVGLASSSGDATATGLITGGGVMSIRTSSALGAYYRLDAFSGLLAA